MSAGGGGGSVTRGGAGSGRGGEGGEGGSLAGRSVAVTGAGGYIARHLRAALHRASARAVCISRRSMRRLYPAEKMVAVDGYAEKGLAAALRGCSTLVHLAGSGRVGTASAAPYTESNEAVAARAAAAARSAASVGRIVYLSGLGASKRATTSYFAAKYAAERALMSSRVPCTILRPSFVVGRGDPLSRGLAAQVRRHGSVLVPGSGPH